MILSMFLRYYELETPLGPMWAAFDERGRLRNLQFGVLDPRATMPLASKSQREVYRYLVRQIGAYFAGTLRTFTLPLAPICDEFQERLWEEVRAIPYGQTLGIEELVRRMGGEDIRPPLEETLNDNPIQILLPSHRVTRPDGSAIQKALLTHEGGPLVDAGD